MRLRILAQKLLCQDDHILPALAYGGNLQNHHGQSVVQVHSETPLCDPTAQIR